MTLMTNKEIEYRSAPYGYIATIPAGTEVVPATNLSRGGYWAEPWANMSDQAESWARNYGFLVDDCDVTTSEMACVKYMSEDEVKDMMEVNEMMPEEEDPFTGFDSDTYDVEAMRTDATNGNFDPESDDPGKYEHTAIVEASVTNGQFRQAKEQCEKYGLDYNDYRPRGTSDYRL